MAELSENVEAVIALKGVIRLGERVYGRFLRMSSGRWEIAIVLGDDTTSADLRAAWAEIDRWRTQVRKANGTDFRSAKALLEVKWAAKKEAGWSPSLIAREINHDILVNLCSAVEDSREHQVAIEDTGGYANAQALLGATHMDGADIEAYLQGAIEEIRKGRAPWRLEDGPVEAQRIRDTIKQVGRDLDSEKLVIKAPPAVRKVPVSDLYEGMKGPLEGANALLEKRFPKSLAKLKKDLSRFPLGE